LRFATAKLQELFSKKAMAAFFRDILQSIEWTASVHRPAVALRRTAPRAGRGCVRVGRLRGNAVIWNSFLPMCRKAREIAPDKFNETPVLSAACLAPGPYALLPARFTTHWSQFVSNYSFTTILPIIYYSCLSNDLFTYHSCSSHFPLICFQICNLWYRVYECATDLCQITFIQLMFHSFTFHLYQIIRSSSNLPPRYH
jgi:hypothetical protein